MACGLWLAACGLSACFPKNENPTDPYIEIVKGEIEAQTYYVPKVYLNPPFKALGDDNIFVLMMYPDFTPIKEPPKELLKQDEWYRNIRILANHAKKPMGNQQLVKSKIEHFKAFEVVGEEYGLIHQKQPDGEIQDFKDVWLEVGENKEYISVVACSEKLTEHSVPQCSHRMYWGNFHVKTSFNKRLLPEWKKIKKNTLALLESFKSEETARAFLKERISKM